MLDTRFAAARTRPISSQAAAQGLPGGMTVRALPATARFSLRYRTTAESTAAVGDFRLDQPINRYVEAGDRWSVRLGPGRMVDRRRGG